MKEIHELLDKVKTLIKHNERFLAVANNRFNMFKVCGVNHYENTHSAIIAEFLKIDGTHGFGREFLQAFLQTIKNETLIDCNFDISSLNTKVHLEYVILEGRIDILITNNHQAIIIENKIYAIDQFEQLKKYSKYGDDNFKSNYQLLYLTLWGNEASEQSGKDVNYKQISYCDTIIKWLDRCVEIATRNAIVRETLIQYINHLKTLTGQDMSTINNEELIELLCKPENLGSVFKIRDNITALKNHIISKIFLPQLSNVCEELELINISEETNNVDKQYYGFKFKNPKWKYFKIEAEFESNFLRNFIIGINHITNERKDETYNKLKERLKVKSNSNYVYYSFPKYINWDKDAMIAIVNGEMAELFKIEIKRLLQFTEGLDM